MAKLKFPRGVTEIREYAPFEHPLIVRFDLIKNLKLTLDELENSGELAIGDITVDKDLLNISKEIVGASGKKVDILQSENLDVIVEVIR